jgi:hypothetical protein
VPQGLIKIRENLFTGLCIYLDCLKDRSQILSKIIKALGGKEETKIKTSNEVTHIVTNRRVEKIYAIKGKNYVNIKWLLHCCLFYERLDENDEEYCQN